MSDRHEKSRQDVQKRFVEKKLKQARNQLTDQYKQLKSIQPDYEDDSIPISFLIMDHENTYFAPPSMTIDELLNGESLKNRIQQECQTVGIDSTLLDSPSIVPRIDTSRTVQHWATTNSENSIFILFKYKDELLVRKNTEQIHDTKRNFSEASVDSEQFNSFKELRQILDKQTKRIEQQDIRIDQLIESNEKLQADNDKQTKRIEQQDIRIDQLIESNQQLQDKNDKQNTQLNKQYGTIESFKSTINSLCITTKPLIRLHRRILIENFRLYLAKKYRGLFEIQTGFVITDETKYFEINNLMKTFLNELFKGPSSSLISPIEKQCLELALTHVGSFYQRSSEEFIHNASKDVIAESVLRTNGKSRQVWLDMFRFVYDEDPNLHASSIDISTIPLDDSDDNE